MATRCLPEASVPPPILGKEQHRWQSNPGGGKSQDQKADPASRWSASAGPSCLLDWEAAEGTDPCQGELTSHGIQVDIQRVRRKQPRLSVKLGYPRGKSGAISQSASWLPPAFPHAHPFVPRVCLGTFRPPSSHRTLKTPAPGPMAKKLMILQPQKTLPKTASTFFPTTHPGVG